MGHHMISEQAARIVQKWNELFHTKSLTFRPATYNDLPLPTKNYLTFLLQGLQLPFQLADHEVLGTVLLKFDDDELAYLHHWPEYGLHIWLDHNFENLPDTTYLSRIAELHGSDRKTAKRLIEYLNAINHDVLNN